MVPLVHPRMFDGALWTLDRWLLFGLLWDASREFLPISHLTQVRLMDNYTKVLRIPEGMSPSAINAAMGIAAFPSLHVASQLYVALWTRRLVPRLGFLLLLTVGAFYVGSVVTGWHYMIDSVAGLLMAWAAYVITTRAWGLSGWRKSAPARPLPRRRGGA